MWAVAPVYGQPQAICVPWQPSNPDIAHYSYSGAQARLKGIIRGPATEFRWDFGGGDGTPWQTIGDPYALEAEHVYSGVPGQPFIATLYVRDDKGAEDQDTYETKIHR